MEMPYSIRQVLAVVLICVVFVPVCSARTARRTAKRYSAKQLIAKIIASEEKIHDVELHYDYILVGRGNHVFASLDWGYEAGKKYCAGKTFALAKPERNIPAWQKQIKQAFDGEKFYLLSEHVTFKDGQVIKKDWRGKIGPDMNICNYLSPIRFLGYEIVKRRPVNRTTVTLGELLRTATKVSVRPKLEKVDGHLCTVVEAIGAKDVVLTGSEQTVTGQTVKHYRDRTRDVRVWIDTQRDFRPLRIETYFGDRGSLNVGRPGRWQVLSCRIEKIKLEKINGIWFPIDGTATWFSRHLPAKKRRKAGRLRQKPIGSGPKRMRVYRDTVRINKGIDPKKFIVAFATGCGVLDDFTGMVYTVGSFDDPTFQPTTEVGKILKALKDREVKVEPELADELVDVLRNCDGQNKYKCYAAIRALIQIGSPAVPELAAELKRTEKAWTQTAVAFILRAVGDASAIDALIDALGSKIAQGSDWPSDFGTLKCDLRRFIKRHQIDPSDPFVDLDSRVREITIALEKLTGHSEGHEHFYNYDEKGNRVYVYLDTPENRARTRKMLQAAAKRWRLWWEKNKQTVLKRDAQNRLNR